MPVIPQFKKERKKYSRLSKEKYVIVTQSRQSEVRSFKKEKVNNIVRLLANPISTHKKERTKLPITGMNEVTSL